MGQVTLYLPEKVEELMKKQAKKNGKSVSSFVTELLEQKLTPKKWSEGFLKVCGTWEGDFPEIKKLKQTPRHELD